MHKQKVILAGGSGFLGRTLVPELVERDYEPVILTRTPDAAIPGARLVPWDAETVGAWAAELEGARAVFGLAGKSVNCRYTPDAVKQINQSRVRSTRALGDAIHRCAEPPEVWVQASSLAIYGDAGERECTEAAPAGSGIPAETCLAWEQAFAESPTPRTRRVLLRISLVLKRDAGALEMLGRLTRLGLGGTLGHGRQYISWIHWQDMNALCLRALEDDSLSGCFNATAPAPVPNSTFMKELRDALHRPWSPPVPRWIVPFGCWLMRTEPVLGLTGRRGLPARLQESGFSFAFPEVRSALRDIFQAESEPPPPSKDTAN